MMSIIGWVAIFYLIAGLAFMMWYWTYLCIRDLSSSFIDEICDEFTHSLGLRIGEHPVYIEVMFTMLLIIAWIVFVASIIYELILLKSKKDRAN